MCFESTGFTNVTRAFEAATIVVILGIAKDYRVHKDVLVEKSTYFRRCLYGNFIESKTGKVTLPEDSPQPSDAS